VSTIQVIVDKRKCLGADECDGICARICPTDIIEYQEEDGKKVPVVTEIELCMKDHGCQNNCPVGAIIVLPPQEEGRSF
jgi:NAD-dependent dihydropyrimidine dehydrogenase PreA subunit